MEEVPDNEEKIQKRIEAKEWWRGAAPSPLFLAKTNEYN